MRVKTRVISAIAAAAFVAAVGMAGTPAGAAPPPAGPGDIEVCTEGCSSHPPPGPVGPDDLANPTGDPGGTDPQPEDPPADLPIPANATFTG
jgi:hypothetical protein